MNSHAAAKQATLRVLAAHFKELDVTEIEVYFLLIGVTDQIRVKVEAMLNKLKINRARMIPLAMLFTAPGKQLRPSELAEHAGCTRATMTGILDGLEDGGLLRRVHDPADRRTLKIELTPAGEKLIRKVLPQHFKNVSKIMAGVSEAERRSLASIFRKIEANITNLE